MSRIETTLSQVAGTTQMETLALVVEEQRRRIDSILTGAGCAVLLCLLGFQFLRCSKWVFDAWAC
jgi:hypothetical protein